MFVDLRELPDGQVFQADVCIAGAGAAGITLAAELAAAGHEVCLLESGGLQFDPPTQQLYEADNAGIARLPATATRLRYFGGSTNHWNGKCARLDPIDFEERAWIPDSGWPISRRELDPFYDRAQPILDLPPLRSGTAVATEFGAPRPPLDESVMGLFAWQLSPPTRLGEKFRARLQSSPRARIVLHANVVNVQANQAADRVVRLDVRSLDGKRATATANSYVLSCGGIENSRLLLASDGVDARGLGNGHDLVGRYFMEHLRNRELIALGRDRYAIERTYNSYRRREGEYLLGLSLSPAVQQRDGILNAGFFPNFDRREPSASATAMQLVRGIMHGRLPEHAIDTGRVLRNLDEILINVRRRLLRPGSTDLTGDLPILVIDSEQAPNRDSRITLGTERDALRMRRASIDWRMSELDRRSVLRSLELCAAQLWLCYGARIYLPDSMDSELAEWVHNFKDVAHHIGGTRMADTPQRGVVDRNCRVHGMDNLYVAGSSVFPTTGQSNPTLTIVALALRLAGELKRTLPAAGSHG